MNIIFNADEIFLVAERIEINGEAFYLKAAEYTTHAPTQAILRKLAAMEEAHLRTFAALRAQLKEQDRRATAFDPTGDAEMYLAALADGRVFDLSDPTKRITGSEPITDVLKIAIGFEKDSVAFYAGMLNIVPEELGKLRVADIIKEEMRHVAILTKQLAYFEGNVQP
ncbi:MAG: rubrerythrin [Planctomycetaceae bacterium]|nr:MAG: rubrerythrin [Planctomycetaceae bacterium]